jgi:hypothetical protein
MRGAILLLAAVPLGGCAVGPAITSLATAGVAGSVGSATGSTALGVAAGFGASYGVAEGVKYGERRLQDTVQIAIASAAAPLAVGYSVNWQLPERAPLLLPAHSGMVEVARTFGQIHLCKEIIFTVEDDHNIYTTTICRNDQGDWTWALAEPSIHRWGDLQ